MKRRVRLLLAGVILAFVTAGLAAAGLWWSETARWRVAVTAPLEVLAADRVVVHKAKRELVLMDGGVAVKRYPVSLGFDPVGHKRREGDGRTPEGVYSLDWRRVSDTLGAAMHISYPNAGDRARAAQAGVDPGGAIMLHALGSAQSLAGIAAASRRWTEGCIALEPRHMREIWYAVADGTPIEIRP